MNSFLVLWVLAAGNEVAKEPQAGHPVWTFFKLTQTEQLEFHRDAWCHGDTWLGQIGNIYPTQLAVTKTPLQRVNKVQRQAKKSFTAFCS